MHCLSARLHTYVAYGCHVTSVSAYAAAVASGLPWQPGVVNETCM